LIAITHTHHVAVRSFLLVSLTLLLLALQAPGLSAWDDPKLHRMLHRSAKWQALQNRLCRQELAGELCKKH
jgi:hypothetical protein